MCCWIRDCWIKDTKRTKEKTKQAVLTWWPPVSYTSCKGAADKKLNIVQRCTGVREIFSFRWLNSKAVTVRSR